MRVGVVILLASALGLAGCAKPPEKELARFRDNHPSEYREFVAPEVATQASKFALFRSYTRTRQLMESIENHTPMALPTGYSDGWRTITPKDMGNGVTCYTYTDAISCVQRK